MYFFLIIVSIIFIILYFYYKIDKETKIKNRIQNRIKNKIEYDNNIEIIKDIKCEEQRIRREDPYEILYLNNLIKEFETNNNWQNIIKIGNIYAKGSYPIFLPNKYLGLKCFQMAMKCPDKKIANQAYIEYIGNKYNIIDDIDKNGIELPTIYFDIISNLVKIKLYEHKYDYISKPNNNMINTIIINNDNINNDNNENINQNNNENINEDNIEIIDDNIEYNNDLQNVHDHAVNKIIISNINKMRERYNIDNMTDNFINTEIYNNIFEDELLNTNNRYDAITTLESLSRIRHNYFNISELDMLKLIYLYIYEKNNKTDLFHILNIELANCVENGHVVCSTGKISRIISIIDGLDNEYNTIKPLNIIKNEIYNLSNRIREKVINEATEDEKMRYNNSTDEVLINRMIEELNNEVDRIYVHDLQMNKEMLIDIINECKLGF